MATHKKIDKICIIIIVFALMVTALIGRTNTDDTEKTVKMGYENRLFDTSRVHTIDIVIDDWDEFIKNCENEEYVNCAVVIDNEVYKNVGIRAKGNTSLSSVSASGGERYSFKIEFDQYQTGNTYHGLDKLCLNNVIQDNTYMKDYIVYQMMNEFGVASPLSSYAYITVNGEDFGLYLAVEGVEESFLTRNYGSNYGDLYKPDGMNMGKRDDENFGDRSEGGMPQMLDMGNRGIFDKNAMPNFGDFDFSQMEGNPFNQMRSGESFNKGMAKENRNENFEIANLSSGERPNMENFDFGNMPGGMGSSDVKLQYIDDNPESYKNIFDSAKTEVTTADQNRLIESLKNLSENKDIENVVDIEEVIKYFVVHNFVCNGDSYTGNMIHNYYLYEEDGKMSMIPWDYNLAFGSFGGGSNANSTINEPIDSYKTDRPMIAWIFQNEEYTKLYHEYFGKFIEEFYTNGRMSEIIENAYTLINSYVEKDPTKFCTYEEFKEGVETLKEFCLLRSQSVEGQLKGTIGTTTEEQKQTENELIDASSLEISNLGSMGKGMGGFGDKGDFRNNSKTDNIQNKIEATDESGEKEEIIPVDAKIPAKGFNINDFNESGDGRQNFGFGNMNNRENPRNMGQMQQENSIDTEKIILTIVSFVILIGGIVFVKKFKR